MKWPMICIVTLITLGAAADNVPLINSTSYHFLFKSSVPNELATFINNNHLKNDIVKPASGILKYDYLVPAGPYFQLFDWDMYFMSLDLSYDGVYAPVASSVKNFLSFIESDVNEPGYVPRIISPQQPWGLPQQCKPFMAQAAVRASLTAGSFDWIEPHYDNLKLMMNYWENSRKATDGLFVWFNGVESGADNNPAVSDKPTEITEGVDLQVYIYREYLALALIGEKLGLGKEAAQFRDKAEALKSLVNLKMYSAKDAFYYNIDSRTGKHIMIKSWTSLTPLWAHMPTQIQANQIIDNHLLNKDEFWSKNGVRTLSKTEKLYDPQDGYWRGPVWVVSNYILMHGLMNYGYTTQALDLAKKTVGMLVRDFRENDSMNECYNPETGAPTAGDHFVSWNLLGERMMDEVTSNLDPTALTSPY